MKELVRPSVNISEENKNITFKIPFMQRTFTRMGTTLKSTNVLKIVLWSMQIFLENFKS